MTDSEVEWILQKGVMVALAEWMERWLDLYEDLEAFEQSSNSGTLCADRLHSWATDIYDTKELLRDQIVTIGAVMGKEVDIDAERG